MSTCTECSPAQALLRADLCLLAGRLGLPDADGAALAALLRALSSAPVAARARRQGVTLIWLGTERVVAVLSYAGRAQGLFAHRADCALAELLDDLKEFRLGWLPDEVVRAQGGLGSVFTGEMPAAAEGFVPTWALGPGRERLAGQAMPLALDAAD